MRPVCPILISWPGGFAAAGFMQIARPILYHLKLKLKT